MLVNYRPVVKMGVAYLPGVTFRAFELPIDHVEGHILKEANVFLPQIPRGSSMLNRNSANQVVIQEFP